MALIIQIVVVMAWVVIALAGLALCCVPEQAQATLPDWERN
ncbi:MAG TPA: hypothetical protein VN541_20290 [Tepidisphaeraceae bacterium]|nr:hypothetical protein [Tepidisphaeraceae bacterium]